MKWMLVPFTLCCLAAMPARSAESPTHSSDYVRIVQGVTEVPLHGCMPGTILLTGTNAFPLIATTNHGVIGAAARMGAGRVVAMAHTSLGGGIAANPQGRLLMQNMCRWLGGKDAPVVGCISRDNASELAAIGFTITNVTLDALKGIDVLVMIHPSGDGEMSTAVRSFILGGGGVLLAVTPWAIEMQDFAADYVGNHILEGSGLLFSPHSAVREPGTLTINPAVPPECLDATTAAQKLQAHTTGTQMLKPEQVGAAATAVESAIGVLPTNSTAFYSALGAIRAAVGDVIPTMQNHVRKDAEPLKRLVIMYDDLLMRRTPVEQTKAHPAAAEYPGAVPANAPRVSRAIAIDGNNSGWEPQNLYAGESRVLRPTGLYAAPGDVVSVTVPKAAVGTGIEILVGTYEIDIWSLDTWERWPSISRKFKVTAEKTLVANPFGGLIFIEVPPHAALGNVKVRIEHAVEAPFFVLGKDTADEWRTRIRMAPGPWAVLMSDTLALVFPSSYLRDFDQPDKMLEMYSLGLDYCADLAGLPRKRPRGEMIMVVRQPIAGWMHAGYPIAAMIQWLPWPLKIEEVKKKGEWGMYHEIGHNHQRPCWLLPGTGESCNNLFSVYVAEKLFTIPSWNAHPALAKAERAKRLKEHMEKGAPFSEFDVWVALDFYLMLQEAFGWDAFIEVFKSYNKDMPTPRQYPHGDTAMFDEFMLRFSKAVNRDLGPYFKAWNLPVSDKALKEAATRPAWTDDPLKQYESGDAASAAPRVSGGTSQKHSRR